MDPEYFLHYITASMDNLETTPDVIPMLATQLVTTFRMSRPKAEEIVDNWYSHRLSLWVNNETEGLH